MIRRMKMIKNSYDYESFILINNNDDNGNDSAHYFGK